MVRFKGTFASAPVVDGVVTRRSTAADSCCIVEMVISEVVRFLTSSWWCDDDDGVNLFLPSDFLATGCNVYDTVTGDHTVVPGSQDQRWPPKHIVSSYVCYPTWC